ncbi:hypothetical protein CYMTET_51142 [Cymbomonas tetramitiformis]|uniref:Uncharacterized protein n=1 Tax=Cymbomonas tetramitiformis TaxID=36881 RepID=A0AAE0ESP8_9CHLO|nr:hypothetical protein CYMTET_51142 [Cymbomonas tetramitiformis]
MPAETPGQEGCGVAVEPAFPVGGGDIDVFWALRTGEGCEGGNEPASPGGNSVIGEGCNEEVLLRVRLATPTLSSLAGASNLAGGASCVTCVRGGSLDLKASVACCTASSTAASASGASSASTSVSTAVNQESISCAQDGREGGGMISKNTSVSSEGREQRDIKENVDEEEEVDENGDEDRDEEAARGSSMGWKAKWTRLLSLALA